CPSAPSWAARTTPYRPPPRPGYRCRGGRRRAGRRIRSGRASDGLPRAAPPTGRYGRRHAGDGAAVGTPLPGAPLSLRAGSAATGHGFRPPSTPVRAAAGHDPGGRCAGPGPPGRGVACCPAPAAPPAALRARPPAPGPAAAAVRDSRRRARGPGASRAARSRRARRTVRARPRALRPAAAHNRSRRHAAGPGRSWAGPARRDNGRGARPAPSNPARPTRSSSQETPAAPRRPSVPRSRRAVAAAADAPGPASPRPGPSLPGRLALRALLRPAGAPAPRPAIGGAYRGSWVVSPLRLEGSPARSPLETGWVPGGGVLPSRVTPDSAPGIAALTPWAASQE